MTNAGVAAARQLELIEVVRRMAASFPSHRRAHRWASGALFAPMTFAPGLDNSTGPCSKRIDFDLLAILRLHCASRPRPLT
jgi:hypothetical protein